MGEEEEVGEETEGAGGEPATATVELAEEGEMETAEEGAAEAAEAAEAEAGGEEGGCDIAALDEK